jgi:plasmid maintenance system antidote protein VapI
MTDRDVRELLRQRCDEAGSVKSFAWRCHLSRSYVSEVIHGRQKISPSICVALGLIRLVRYEPLETSP